MRITLFCSLLLAIACTVYAEAAQAQTLSKPAPSQVSAGIQQVSTPSQETEPIIAESVLTKDVPVDGATQDHSILNMLTSLMDLRKNINLQITTITQELALAPLEVERQALQKDLAKLHKQFAESGADFERIATGVEPTNFSDQQKMTFSWKDELATLLEPSIKELKELTYRTRLKSDLKETINGYERQRNMARKAVKQLNKLIGKAKKPTIKAYLVKLLPAWQDAEKRISSKLSLSQLELDNMEDSDGSLLENSSHSIREFFRNRGRYMLIGFVVFVGILLLCHLLARLLFSILPGAKKEQRPIHVRIIDLFLRGLSLFVALLGLVFVLYAAEDWFLLSATIIFLIGLTWTIRLTLPKMWQQARLILNMGSIREGERVLYQGVPWRVESINLFCKLFNSALGIHLRIPIEEMIGLISRPYHTDEAWFPCKREDWIAIEGKPFAKVVSLSHQQVEVVELGGQRTVYQTGDFLSLAPVNLSRNFNIKVIFGLSYALQAEITTTALETLNTFLHEKMAEQDYAEDCLSLSVDFLQAGASSLDLVIRADFKGEQAPAFRRIERTLNRWCVDCCNANNWEIPFPQLAVHLPSGTSSTTTELN